jgi:hypothetical protein
MAQIKNNGNNGSARTPSGHGVVNGGRAGNGNGGNARNGNNSTSSRTSKAPAPRTHGTPDRGWWESVKEARDEPMHISAGLHRLADSIYDPRGDVDAPRRTSRGTGQATSAKTAKGNATKATSKTRSR